MRQSAQGDFITLLADDPKAESEIIDLARANGWSIAVETKDGEYSFSLTR